MIMIDDSVIKRNTQLALWENLVLLWHQPVTGEFSAQMASNAEIVSILWRHHDKALCLDSNLSYILPQLTNAVFNNILLLHFATVL